MSPITESIPSFLSSSTHTQHTHTSCASASKQGFVMPSQLLNKQNCVSQQRTGHQIKSQGVPLMPARAVVPFK